MSQIWLTLSVQKLYKKLSGKCRLWLSRMKFGQLLPFALVQIGKRFNLCHSKAILKGICICGVNSSVGELQNNKLEVKAKLAFPMC